ncbi:MAG: shikimate kinase [Muribaculaceae bacterium]|nr:shikimate kinase [Muribaculaceae bacterium]MBR6640278.1 shikimate kinase [Muribaculaceae bacterium]
MRPIFLVGYMGCGKSTLGRAVSRASGMRFIDLDNYIEGRYHRTVKEIFAEKGEDGFRDVERRMLHEVADFEDVIVACGGGTPCFFDNMEYMNEHGTSVFLDTPIEKLHSRLMKGRHKRPLIAEKNDEELRQFIIEALAKRMEYYSKAQVIFPSDLLETTSEIAQTVKLFLEKFSISPIN